MTRSRALLVLAALVGVLALTFAVRSGAQAPSAPPPRPAAPPSVRLYVFDGGTLESDPTRYRLTKEDVGTTQLSVAAYLVAHPRGLLMWDTGAITDADWTPTGSPSEQKFTLPDGQSRTVTLRTPLKTQLTAVGYSAGDITHLALSHYHWDHTANANAFAGATFLVRQVERDTMFANLPPGTYRPATYAALRNSKTVIIKDDEYDVFGDGSVIIKSAPGHTVGHQVLYVKLPKTGGVVLAGDLYHYPQERALDRLPTFEFSEDQTRVSRRDVEAFLKKTGAQLWIQHDFVAHAKLKKAPEYYD